MGATTLLTASIGLSLLWSVHSSVLRAGPPVDIVRNGSSEVDADGNGAPDGWTTAGRAEVEQELTLDVGRDGGRSARLSRTTFVDGAPDAHVMMYQVGAGAMKRGEWYRLSLWVKGRGLKRFAFQTGFMKTRPWGSSGINASFSVTPDWRHVERFCRATDDVPAGESRFQFWHYGTGTLWSDDIVLEPVQLQEGFHPPISADGVTNLIPNSGFECGAAGWGSYAPDLVASAGNVYRMLGEIDETVAFHGSRSLRIRLGEGHAPVYQWDYLDAGVEPVRALVAAHVGWAPLQPGKPHVLSCRLKADRPGTPGLLLMRQSNCEALRHPVRVDTQWKLYSFTFTPQATHGWAGMGLASGRTPATEATLWIDAVQPELADQPSDYSPRSDLESFIETRALGNIFADPRKELRIDVQVANGGRIPRTVRGHLSVTDFRECEGSSRDVETRLGPGAPARIPLADLFPGRRGFFRVHWRPEGSPSAFASAKGEQPALHAAEEEAHKQFIRAAQ